MERPTAQASRETVKVDGDVLDLLRKIAERDGFVLGKLIDRVIVAGMKAEGLIK